jgi:hypothetical protein
MQSRLSAVTLRASVGQHGLIYVSAASPWLRSLASHRFYRAGRRPRQRTRSSHDPYDPLLASIRPGSFDLGELLAHFILAP